MRTQAMTFTYKKNGKEIEKRFTLNQGIKRAGIHKHRTSEAV